MTQRPFGRGLKGGAGRSRRGRPKRSRLPTGAAAGARGAWATPRFLGLPILLWAVRASAGWTEKSYRPWLGEAEARLLNQRYSVTSRSKPRTLLVDRRSRPNRKV